MAEAKIIAPFKVEEQEYKEPDYTKEEIQYREFLIKRAIKAKNMREDSHIEFDDMDYDTNYETNYKAGNSYIRPKKNKTDSRIVTGTTLEKENTFLSSILNYNFEPTIEVFDDENRIIMSLGDTIGSMVKKSKLMEDYDTKRALIYKEGADQGNSFVVEEWQEEWKIAKKLKNFDYETMDIKKIEWDSKREKNIIGCQSNLLPGTAVYLGNIKQFFMHKQPFVFTRDVITYEESKSLYEEYERFEFVPKKITRSLDDDNEIREWTLEEMEDGFVEVLKYYDPYANEYMLQLNGVMMLPVGFPLTVISPSGAIPIAKLDMEAISQFFAYSKSYPAKTKVDQEILDDTIRTMVLRLKQMQKPPLANNTGSILNEKIFYPGVVVNNINPDRLQPILGTQGISAGEVQVFNMIKEIVDEKTSAPIMSGGGEQGKQTATEIMLKKQQSMMKLGYAIYGIINFERQLTWLRIYNLIPNWTKKIDSKVDEVNKTLKDIYGIVTVDENDEYGKFTKVIEFSEEGLDKSPEQLDAEAQIMSTDKKKIQKVIINPKMLRDGFLKWNFSVNISPSEKETTELKSVLFDEKVMKAKQIYGPMSTNDEYCKQRSAVLAGEDPDQFWAKQQPMQPGMEGMEGMAGGQGQAPVTEEMLKSIPQGQRPTINTLSGQV